MHFKILNEIPRIFLIEKELKKWGKHPHSIGSSFSQRPQPNSQGGPGRRHGERDARGAWGVNARSGGVGPSTVDLPRGSDSGTHRLRAVHWVVPHRRGGCG
jgi:hypothetical protein